MITGCEPRRFGVRGWSHSGLSRIKWLLFVIARNSSFVYKGKAVDVRQIGRELGVRYVLEGGVRRSGKRLRITTQLIEAETAVHLWADRFDGAIEDVFDLQDQITERVVGMVEPSLQRSEIERSRRKRPDNLDAYDLYLRAFPHVMKLTPEQVRVGADFLNRALMLDPNYPAAHALLSLCHEICYGQDGFDEVEKGAGLLHAHAALSSGADDATALAVAAMTIAHLGRDYYAAASAIERALSFNASSTTALYFGAHINSFRGNCAVVTAYAARALRLSPFDPWAYEGHVAFAMAAIQASRYDEPASHFAKAVQANPSFTSPRFLLAMTFGERWTHRGSLFYPVVRGPTFRRGGVAAAAARVMKAIAVVAIELPIAQRRERQLSPHGLNRFRGRRGERRLGLAEG